MVEFDGKDISRGAIQVHIEGTYEEESAALNLWWDNVLKEPETLRLYPWGNKWFLPCYEFKGKCRHNALGVSIHIDSDFRLIQDNRTHARLLRWGYQRVWVPILRLWP